jgi:hypothetical protein
MNKNLLFSLILFVNCVTGFCQQLEYPGTPDTLTGEELVFDFSTQGISLDYPDAGARAFRDAGGNIQLLASHYNAYRMKGTDFNNLARDYSNGPVYTSANNSTYSNFNQLTWIAAPYTTDGVHVHSLMHTEYDGPNASNWTNSITYSYSSDTGKTYIQAASPAHLVWTLPYQYAAGNGPCGYFGPSNIVFNQADGYYYCMLHLEHRGSQQTGVGLIRTTNLSDPTSWRGWDGTGFNATCGNPYDTNFTGITGHFLQPLNDLNDNIGTMSESLTFNTYFNKWMLVGSCQQSVNGTNVLGFYYSLSSDLIHWSFRKLIKQEPISWGTATWPKVAYPSVIDQTDTSRNFTYAGRDVYIYYTKMNSDTDRDLVRMKFRFNKNMVTPTFTVNTTTDNTTTAVDANYGDGSAVSKISGTTVSLRSAILESNARPPAYFDSVYTINFSLAGGGTQTLTLAAALPEIKYPIVLNGYSQTGAVANTAAFGSSMNGTLKININCNNFTGISVNGTGTTIKGLATYNANGASINLYDGHGNTIKGCYVGIQNGGTSNGTYPEIGVHAIDIGGYGSDASYNNTIGGTNAADRNVIAGGVYIYGSGSTGNKIYGNYIGTDATGGVAIDRNYAGVQISDSASYNYVGGASTSMGNLISGNDDVGILISDPQTSHNYVMNNYIGMKANMSNVLDNGQHSVRITNGAHHNEIGNQTAGNIIAKGLTALISIEDSPNNSVQNNHIGTNAAETTSWGLAGPAIVIDGTGSNNNLIGGVGNNLANVIAHVDVGISTTGCGYGNSFLSNRFISIADMAIDLAADGVSNNDSLDNDPIGGIPDNYLQNFPEMLDADSVAGGVRVCGELNSNPNKTVTIQIYKSSTQTSSTFGAGEQLIGSVSGTTASNGVFRFSTTISTPVTTSNYISVSATDSSGNTSELGENWPVGNGSNATPTFIWLSNTSLPENSPVGYVVGTFTAQDPNLCDNHTFTLVSGSLSQGNSSFTISGNQLLANGTFNYEGQNTYNLRVRCTDQDGAYYEKTWPITVTNVNEAPTALNLSGNTTTENLPAGTNVGTFSSTDPDATGNTFTYTLVNGQNSNHNSLFTIAGNQLKTATVLDADTTPQMFIRVRTTDAGGQYYENMFTITVNGVNEPPTGVIASTNTIPENLPANSIIASLSTADEDSNDPHIYSLVSGTGSTNNSMFGIIGSGLKAINPFDYETATPLSIRVRTTDSHGLMAESVLTFTITNVNEVPTNLTVNSSTVSENQPAGTNVMQFTTTDPDISDPHTYTLVPGTGSTNNNLFSISNDMLVTNTTLNFESMPSLTVRVRSTDSGGLTYEKDFAVNVVDANDPPSDIALSGNSVNENQPGLTTIGTLSSADEDVIDSHTYSLVNGTGGTNNNLVRITGNVLKTKAPYNFEATPTLSIRLQTTDSHGSSYEKVMTINVNNVNEAPTAVNLQTDSVDENLPQNSIVTSLTSVDVDAGDSHTYQLVAGTGDADNASFAISGNDLIAVPSFDFETKNSYQIRLRTTDAGGLNTENQRIIYVRDINELPTAIKTAADNTIRIYPNPAHDLITISNAPVSEGCFIRLYDILGKKVLETNSMTIDCKTFVRGVYFLEINSDKGHIQTARIVLE